MPRRKTADLMIDWEAVAGMAQRFIPPDLIAQAIELSPVEFRRAVKHFQKTTVEKFMAKWVAQGQIALVDAQFKKAIDEKNTHMQKWLGIQYLGQRHRVDILNKAGNDAPSSAPPPDATGFTFVDESGQTITVVPGTPEPPKIASALTSKEQNSVGVVLAEELLEGRTGSAGGPANLPENTRTAKQVFDETGH